MNLPDPKRFSIRLLAPFYLTEPFSPATHAKLEASTYAGKNLWRSADLHVKYTEEALPELERFLFPPEGKPVYFGLDKGLCDSWFRAVTAVVLNGHEEARWRKQLAKRADLAELRPQAVPLSLDPKYGIELFVLHKTLGVLSLTFKEPARRQAAHQMPLTATRGAQYHLSHLKFRAPILRVPHPAIDPMFSPECESALERELWLDDPIEDRLGRPGQPFRLQEVRDAVLAPIAGSIQSFEQQQFLAHTVVRFDNETEFGSADGRRAYIRELVAFAQIEEEGHAPAATDHPGLPSEVLNTKHIAAYSYLGGCHFVADQHPREESPGTYDEDRAETIQRKYFTVFLTTLAQRMLSHRFLETVVRKRLARQPLGDAWERFTSFEAAGQLIDLSRREAVNRCYRLSQMTQRVIETTGSLHRIFRDLQASEQADRQSAMLERQHKLAEEQEATRRRLSLIEIFIVAVYTAELVNILGEKAGFPHLYVFGGVSVLGALALWTVLKHHQSATHDHSGTRWLLVLSVLTLILWLLIGFGWEWRYVLLEPEKLMLPPQVPVPPPDIPSG
jgi:hypothetical protein